MKPNPMIGCKDLDDSLVSKKPLTQNNGSLACRQGPENEDFLLGMYTWYIDVAW